MMVGHAMLAFALVATVAHALGEGRERALVLGTVAGAFAVVPDVDMTYAVLGATQAQMADVWAVTDAFWRSSYGVHRSITHSVVVAIPAALAFAWAVAGPAGGLQLPGSTRSLSVRQVVAVGILAGLIVVAFLVDGPLGAAIMTVFAISGVAVAYLAVHRVGLSVRAVAAVGLAGLVTHPFGDVFTGSPPEFLYPFDGGFLASRVVLVGDPTLNLLAIFGLELATIWLAAVVFVRFTDRRLVGHVHRRAVAGTAYGVAALVLPAPTLSVSYHFVFTVLAIGTIGIAPRGARIRQLCRPSTWSMPRLPSPSVEYLLTASLTGLTAVTLGAGAYLAGYVLTQGFF